MDQEQIGAIVDVVAGFLTPEQAKTAMAWLYFLSAVYAGVRWALARWAPAFSNKAAVVAVDRLLHALFANSKPLELRKNVVRERLSNPPPPPKRKPTGLPGFVVLFALLTPQLTACATASLEQTTRSSLDAALTVADLSHSVASDACDQKNDADRCEAIDVAFERIADIGESALQALDRGAVQQAIDMYNQIASLLRGLRR